MEIAGPRGVNEDLQIDQTGLRFSRSNGVWSVATIQMVMTLNAGAISQAQFDLAWHETNRVVGLLEFGGLNLCDLPTF